MVFPNEFIEWKNILGKWTDCAWLPPTSETKKKGGATLSRKTNTVEQVVLKQLKAFVNLLIYDKPFAIGLTYKDFASI